MKFSTWDEVLNPGSEMAGEYVCFRDLPRTGEERIILADEEDWSDGDEWVPSAALAVGMARCLDDGQIREIVDKVSAQLTSPSLAEYRRAVTYYFENDAFMRF